MIIPLFIENVVVVPDAAEIQHTLLKRYLDHTLEENKIDHTLPDNKLDHTFLPQ